MLSGNPDSTALINEIEKNNGFNYLCEGNGYYLSNGDAREIIKELLYAIETANILECERKAIISEFLENIRE